MRRVYETLVLDGLLEKSVRPLAADEDADEAFEVVLYETTDAGKWALSVHDRISKADRGGTGTADGGTAIDPGEEKCGARAASKASPGDSSASLGRADVATMLRALAAIHGPMRAVDAELARVAS